MRSPAASLSLLVALLAWALAACGERSEAPAPQVTEAPAAGTAEAPTAAAPAEPAAPAPGTGAAPAAPAAEAEAAAPEAAPASEPAAQGATIELELYKAGFIVGVSGGRGTLHFEGRSYPLTIGGVSVGATAGVSKAELVGSVRNLRQVGDIEGTYTALQAGLTLGGGEKVTQLENNRKVRLEVRGKQIGIELSLDLNGMQISLAR